MSCTDPVRDRPLEMHRPPHRGSRPMCEASGAPHRSRPPRLPPTRLPALVLTCRDHRRAWRVPGECAGRRDRTARIPQTLLSMYDLTRRSVYERQQYRQGAQSCEVSQRLTRYWPVAPPVDSDHPHESHSRWRRRVCRIRHSYLIKGRAEGVLAAGRAPGGPGATTGG